MVVVRLVAAMLLWSAIARAHVGASPAVAEFSSPAGPVITSGDSTSTVAPFTFTDADQTATVAWSDGDVDPTGYFTFYAVSGEPHYTVDPSTISATGLPIHEAGSTAAVSIWTSCTCVDGNGITCPDAGVRDCRNGFIWDTSAVPEGSWWIVAVNDDPPYLTYSAARAPVVVHHGTGTPPPSVIVARPAGTVGNWDQSFTLQWLARGDGPLTFALGYGESRMTPEGPGPSTPLPLAVTGPEAGVYSAVWDLRALPSKTQFYVTVTVTDSDGRSTVTSSRDAVTVYHPLAPDAGAVDMAASPSTTHGCEMETAPSSWPWLLAVLMLMIVIFGRRYGRH